MNIVVTEQEENVFTLPVDAIPAGTYLLVGLGEGVVTVYATHAAR